MHDPSKGRLKQNMHVSCFKGWQVIIILYQSVAACSLPNQVVLHIISPRTSVKAKQRNIKLLNVAIKGTKAMPSHIDLLTLLRCDCLLDGCPKIYVSILQIDRLGTKGKWGSFKSWITDWHQWIKTKCHLIMFRKKRSFKNQPSQKNKGIFHEVPLRLLIIHVVSNEVSKFRWWPNFWKGLITKWEISY